MKKFSLTTILLLFPLLLSAQQKAKYVFYFIGDGMGFNHVSVTEYWLGHTEGVFDSRPLAFSQFPVLGWAVTHSASNLITDSAAAGTALSTGSKTDNGMLGVAPDTTKLESIASKIHNAGYKVGISSTVGINHATPGAFYGHSASRSNYYDIAMEIPASGFEFGMDEFYGMKAGAGKMMLLQEDGRMKTELPYAIDMTDGDMTQADLVKASIDFLYDGDGQGFFVMSEGGRIDWASHGNDTKTMILETLSLSEAVAEAVKFYNEHPDETLIVVTADHETGGLTMSWKSGYDVYFDKIENIGKSKDFASDEERKAMDEASHAAHIGWTTGDHSGANVPVFAIGAGSSLFSGRMDNTEIPKKICEAMGITF